MKKFILSVVVILGLSSWECFAEAKSVNYEQFGAVGDGRHNDMPAIVAAHDYANSRKLPVRVTDGKSYYIGRIDRTAIIRTDTDFGTARFLIDDRDVHDQRGRQIFEVAPSAAARPLTNVPPLKRGAANLGIKLPEPGLVCIQDRNVRRYIRGEANRNNGTPQRDILLVDREGNIAPAAPPVWDYETVTDATVMPIDTETLTVQGGIFTTIANAAPSKYTYYRRGIGISRSHVVIRNLKHFVEGEGETGAPYYGFLSIAGCAEVLVEDVLFTAHKVYYTKGSSGDRVPMGSYDMLATDAVNVTFRRCRQSNSIHDRHYWGIFGSNYCKNLTFDSCILSRFDAHQGVANATIRNCELGHSGISIIGFGTLLVENTSVTNRNFIFLRSDYGSSWQGKIILRNCTLKNGATLIGGYNSGMQDFGYPCYLPEEVVIDNVTAADNAVIFGNFNWKNTSPAWKEKFPYHMPKKVTVRNSGTVSGAPLRLSSNPYMFRNVEVDRQ